MIFTLGIAIVVAPLTSAIAADPDEGTAGIASGVNDAVARVAGLLALGAAVGMCGLGDLRRAQLAPRDPQPLRSD